MAGRSPPSPAGTASRPIRWLSLGCLRHGAIAIPKAASLAHVRENRAAADLALSSEDLATIDAAFAPPSRKQRLDML